MSGKIQINPNEGDSPIGKLEAMLYEIDAEINKKPSDKVGGGSSVDVMSKTPDKLNAVLRSLKELVSTSKTFFENAQKSFVESDKNSADGIAKK